MEQNCLIVKVCKVFCYIGYMFLPWWKYFTIPAIMNHYVRQQQPWVIFNTHPTQTIVYFLTWLEKQLSKKDSFDDNFLQNEGISPAPSCRVVFYIVGFDYFCCHNCSSQECPALNCVNLTRFTGAYKCPAGWHFWPIRGVSYSCFNIMKPTTYCSACIHVT